MFIGGGSLVVVASSLRLDWFRLEAERYTFRVIRSFLVKPSAPSRPGVRIPIRFIRLILSKCRTGQYAS